MSFSVWFSDHHLNIRTFYNRTLIYHLKTGLVWYSDGYCTKIIIPQIFKLVLKNRLTDKTQNIQIQEHFTTRLRSITQIPMRKILCKERERDEQNIKKIKKRFGIFTIQTCLVKWPENRTEKACL